MIIPTQETYDELQRAYEFFNQRLFESALPPCLITLQREKRTYGYFSNGRFVGRYTGQIVDEIAMNPVYFSIRTIRDTLSTLVHEMVHQLQQHTGKPGRRGYHNKEWAAMMERIGLIPSDTGQPGGKRVGESMSHYIEDGGAFDTACKELLTTEFKLSWLDRFPPHKPTPPTPTGADGKGYVDDEDYGDEGYGDDGELDDEITQALSLVNPPPDTPVNKSNRTKYTCPKCHTNVWGKPGLILYCGGEHCGKAEYQPT